MSFAELEGLADWVLDYVGLDEPPVDAFDLHELLDLPPLRWAPGSGGRCDAADQITVGTSTPIRRLHSVIAHECAHSLLRRFRMRNDERNASYLGAALLVPRRALDRQLRTGWNLEALRACHINASAELLARRVRDVRRHASVAIYDRGTLRQRFGARHADESRLADAAARTHSPVRLDDLTGAWPVVTDGWARVIVLTASDPT